MTFSIIKTPRTMSFRNIKRINLDILSSALSSCLSLNNLSTLDDLVSYYNHSLSSILNSLAPLKTRPVSFSHSAPWYTPELWLWKAKSRRLECLHKKTGLTIHKKLFNNHVLFYIDCINQTKSAYYSTIVCSSEDSTKTLFSLFKYFLRPSDFLPAHLYSSNFCDSLKLFFTLKIYKIHQDLAPVFHVAPPSQPHPHYIAFLPSNFPLSLISLISSACLPSLLPLISEIIHSSFTT